MQKRVLQNSVIPSQSSDWRGDRRKSLQGESPSDLRNPKEIATPVCALVRNNSVFCNTPFLAEIRMEVSFSHAVRVDVDIHIGDAVFLVNFLKAG